MGVEKALVTHTSAAVNPVRFVTFTVYVIELPASTEAAEGVTERPKPKTCARSGVAVVMIPRIAHPRLRLREIFIRKVCAMDKVPISPVCDVRPKSQRP